MNIKTHYLRLFLITIFLVFGKLNAQDATLFSTKYFKNNAQNSAVISAKYANLAYKFTKDIVHNQNDLQNRQNLDTALYFINKALIGIDSTHYYAKDSLTRDSTKMGLIYAKKCRNRLFLAKKNLFLSHKIASYYSSQEYAERAMYHAGNAISEAYTASIYFTTKNTSSSSINQQLAPSKNENDSTSKTAPNANCACCEEIKEMLTQLIADGIPVSNEKKEPVSPPKKTNTKPTEKKPSSTTPTPPLKTNNGASNIIKEDHSKEIKRLEADEATLTAIKAMYEKRMTEKQDKIDLLTVQLNNAKTDTEKAEIQAKLSKVKSQKGLLANKRNGAEKKLIAIRSQLDKLMKQGGYNRSSNATQPIFSFDKGGYYNENNPIPINQPIPKGLIYSIQLGVYHKHAVPSLYKGLYPLDGQTVAGGMFKYRTGIFYSYEQVTEIKNKVHNMGLTDAFIIAYFDGELISISKAIRLE